MKNAKRLYLIYEFCKALEETNNACMEICKLKTLLNEDVTETINKYISLTNEICKDLKSLGYNVFHARETINKNVIAMMKTFDNQMPLKTTFKYYGTIPVEKKIRSIFDGSIAGQEDTNGNYYIIHVDHNTHERYAMTRESEIIADFFGRPLKPNEEAVFNGKRVRGMTFSEEREWDTGMLMAHVDIWGNVAVDEPFDYEWFYENCL